MIVLHILGADFALSRYFAARLADRGVAALFVKLPYYGERTGGRRGEAIPVGGHRPIGGLDAAGRLRRAPSGGLAGEQAGGRREPAGGDGHQPWRDRVVDRGVGRSDA